MTIRSPFQNPNGDMPKPVKGKSLMPPPASKTLNSDVPVGESFGENKPGPINSPYFDGNQKVMGKIRGPKNK